MLFYINLNEQTLQQVADLIPSICYQNFLDSKNPASKKTGLNHKIYIVSNQYHANEVKHHFNQLFVRFNKKYFVPDAAAYIKFQHEHPEAIDFDEYVTCNDQAYEEITKQYIQNFVQTERLVIVDDRPAVISHASLKGCKVIRLDHAKKDANMTFKITHHDNALNPSKQEIDETQDVNATKKARHHTIERSESVLENLSDEILLKVLTYLDPVALNAASMTYFRMHDVATSQFKDLYKTEFNKLNAINRKKFEVDANSHKLNFFSLHKQVSPVLDGVKDILTDAFGLNQIMFVTSNAKNCVIEETMNHQFDESLYNEYFASFFKLLDPSRIARFIIDNDLVDKRFSINLNVLHFMINSMDIKAISMLLEEKSALLYETNDIGYTPLEVLLQTLPEFSNLKQDDSRSILNVFYTIFVTYHSDVRVLENEPHRHEEFCDALSALLKNAQTITDNDIALAAKAAVFFDDDGAFENDLQEILITKLEADTAKAVELYNHHKELFMKEHSSPSPSF